MLKINIRTKPIVITIYSLLYISIYVYFYMLHRYILPKLSSTFTFPINYIWVIRLGYCLIGIMAIWFYLDDWLAKKMPFVPKLIIRTTFFVISIILFSYAYIPDNSGNIVAIFIGYILFGIIRDIYSHLKQK